MVYASRFLRTAHPAMQGPDVSEVQSQLKELGYYSGVIDGVYRAAVAEAVQSFQTSRRLPADGIVGPDTWCELQRSRGEVSKAPAQQGITILVDVDQRQLTYTAPGSEMKTYPIAVGKKSTPTPLGNWHIVQKTLNPGGPFGTRWMRLSVPWGGYGIHGTNRPSSIGKRASHGCIRLYNQDVEELYDRTPLGTPVYIFGEAHTGRLLQLGSKGSDVKGVQKRLKKLGYYHYKTDGYFGELTRQAVTAFQTDQLLTPDGIVGPRTYAALQKAADMQAEDFEP